MNVRCSFCLIFMLNILSTQAQDIIVTARGDTIKCRIVSVSGDYIVYEQFVSGKGNVGDRLSVEEISTYIRGENSNDLFREKKSTPPALRWQIGIQDGIGLMLAKDKDTDRDYHNLLKWGNHYGADIHYLLNHSIGVGIKYSGFFTSADSYQIVDPRDGLTYRCVNMKDRIYINFIGLSFYTQQYLPDSDKFRMAFGSAFGFAYYRNEIEFDYFLVNHLLKANSFGCNLELSFEYVPLSWMSIGAYLSCFGAWFREGTLTNYYESKTMIFKNAQMNNINALRLDLSIGIKFHL